jgi:PKD repeat protein
LVGSARPNWWGSASPGNLSMTVEQVQPPPNDDFAAALEITGLPFSTAENSGAATVQAGEPAPSCLSGGRYHTLWYKVEPGLQAPSLLLSLPQASNNQFLAIYTGASLDSLSLLSCVENAGYYGPTFLALHPDETYYIQVGSTYEQSYGAFTLEAGPTRPPEANFYTDPRDPSIFDAAVFVDSTSDPYSQTITEFFWDFGDGVTASEYAELPQYAADGDYTVLHRITTSDGRSDDVTRTITVSTHDVGITRVGVPLTARVGQTRTITIGLSNTRYPEPVEVTLLKSTPRGYEWVGVLRQTVPIRPANRTTEFTFNYTFTAEDASLGKITFKVYANPTGYRDALPGDNTYVSAPVRVGR